MADAPQTNIDVVLQDLQRKLEDMQKATQALHTMVGHKLTSIEAMMGVLYRSHMQEVKDAREKEDEFVRHFDGIKPARIKPGRKL